MNFVPILNFEGLKLLAGRIRVSGRRKLDRKHAALLVRFDALDFYVAQRGRRKDSTRQFEHVSKGTLAVQLIDRGTTNHSVHGHLRS